MNEKNFQLRAHQGRFQTRSEEGGAMRLCGYFAVFNQPYYIDEWVEEIIAPGAFDGCDMSDVRALIDHRAELVLGRNTVNTLELSIDDTGLYGEILVNAGDSDAVNLYSRTQRGDVDQASFGFDEESVEYTDLPDGRVRRTIRKIKKLWEVSVCTFPAYEQTYVEARSRSACDVKAEQARREKQKKEELRRRLHKYGTQTP